MRAGGGIGGCSLCISDPQLPCLCHEKKAPQRFVVIYFVFTMRDSFFLRRKQKLDFFFFCTGCCWCCRRRRRHRYTPVFPHPSECLFPSRAQLLFSRPAAKSPNDRFCVWGHGREGSFTGRSAAKHLTAAKEAGRGGGTNKAGSFFFFFFLPTQPPPRFCAKSILPSSSLLSTFQSPPHPPLPLPPSLLRFVPDGATHLSISFSCFQ